MPRIYFQGKRYTVGVENRLQRHSNRGAITDSENHHLVGLNKIGKANARAVGEKLPKDMRLKTYFSPSTRTRQTAHHIHNGHLSTGGEAAKYRRKHRLGMREELLGEQMYKDGPFADKVFAKYGFIGFNKKWLERKNGKGGFPPSKIVPPEKLSTPIIKKRVALGRRAVNQGVRNWRIVNATHDMQMMAVLEALTGRKMEQLGVTVPNYNEAITIHHTTSGKDILEYQGVKVDVTKNLKKFMKRNGALI